LTDVVARGSNVHQPNLHPQLFANPSVSCLSPTHSPAGSVLFSSIAVLDPRVVSLGILSNRFTANIATYGCESWTLRKNEETRLDAFEMKGLRSMLRVSWTAKKTNERVLIKAGVKRELLHTVKARKLAYYGYIMRK